jgi:hypothetical protein
VTGTQLRVDRDTQFTRYEMTEHLALPDGEDAYRARHALEKAEHNCLISSSLKAPVDLDTTVEIAVPAEVATSASDLAKSATRLACRARVQSEEGRA